MVHKGKLGNKNAVKTDSQKISGSRVNLVMTPHRKVCYVKSADKEGLKLSAWIRKHLDRVARSYGYDPDEKSGYEPNGKKGTK